MRAPRVVVWMQLSTPRTLGWASPSSRPVSRELLHGPRSTAAVVASALAGVRTALRRPALLCHRDAAAVVKTTLTCG
jgi:hypothetical protein